MDKRTAYLGPEFSFCEEAALRYTGLERSEMLACPTIEAVFAMVYEGKAWQGVVPIENSCEGAVNQTMDLLAYDYDLKITGEIVIPVQHNLLVKSGTNRAEITNILSHPQALAQCRKHLSSLLPDAELKEVSSTAQAARMVAESAVPWGAVASTAAANAYGLDIMKSGIHDMEGNETRFITISREAARERKGCKTSLLLHTLHQPGALYQCLQEFSTRGVNLNKIESRPARTRIGQYLFFIDIDGHYEDPQVVEALQALGRSAQEVRILGSYPMASPAQERETPLQSLAELREKIDRLDQCLIEILGQRNKVVEQVAIHKQRVRHVQDLKRENEVLTKLEALARQNGLEGQMVKELYEIVFRYSSDLQRQRLSDSESRVSDES